MTDPLPTLPRRAGNSLRTMIVNAAAHYDRTRHLRRLIPVLESELADTSPATAGAIISRLEKALRFERSRGHAGHWSYSLNRHMALSQALRAEKQRLKKLTPHER